MVDSTHSIWDFRCFQVATWWEWRIHAKMGMQSKHWDLASSYSCIYDGYMGLFTLESEWIWDTHQICPAIREKMRISLLDQVLFYQRAFKDLAVSFGKICCTIQQTVRFFGGKSSIYSHDFAIQGAVLTIFRGFPSYPHSCCVFHDMYTINYGMPSSARRLCEDGSSGSAFTGALSRGLCTRLSRPWAMGP